MDSGCGCLFWGPFLFIVLGAICLALQFAVENWMVVVPLLLIVLLGVGMVGYQRLHERLNRFRTTAQRPVVGVARPSMPCPSCGRTVALVPTSIWETPPCSNCKKTNWIAVVAEGTQRYYDCRTYPFDPIPSPPTLAGLVSRYRRPYHGEEPYCGGCGDRLWTMPDFYPEANHEPIGHHHYRLECPSCGCQRRLKCEDYNPKAKPLLVP